MNVDEIDELFKRDVNIDEIIRFAFWKYRLSGKKSMNTFIFTQAKNNNLSDEEVNNIIDALEIKIEKYKKDQEKKEEKQAQAELKRNLKILNKNIKP